jgi:hypothetical protein
VTCRKILETNGSTESVVGQSASAIVNAVLPRVKYTTFKLARQFPFLSRRESLSEHGCFGYAKAHFCWLSRLYFWARHRSNLLHSRKYEKALARYTPLKLQSKGCPIQQIQRPSGSEIEAAITVLAVLQAIKRSTLRDYGS